MTEFAWNYLTYLPPLIPPKKPSNFQKVSLTTHKVSETTQKRLTGYQHYLAEYSERIFLYLLSFNWQSKSGADSRTQSSITPKLLRFACDRFTEIRRSSAEPGHQKHSNISSLIQNRTIDWKRWGHFWNKKSNAHANLANLPATPARAARKLSLSAPGPSARKRRENRSTEIFHLLITWSGDQFVTRGEV